MSTVNTGNSETAGFEDLLFSSFLGLEVQLRVNSKSGIKYRTFIFIFLTDWILVYVYAFDLPAEPYRVVPAHQHPAEN